jgi:hypothetical protein
MPRLTSLFFRCPLVLLPLVLACQVPGQQPDGDAETSEDDGDGDGDSGDGDADTDADTGSPIFNCDPSEEMSCPEGQKCTVIESGGVPVYDCVPDDTGLLPFEPCTPAPMTGQDQCPDNHVCLAPSPDSQMGLCLQLCTNDDDCDSALCIAPPDSLIPVCAAICDPLTPLCPGDQDCQRVRQTNFVCQYPRPTDIGITADPCDIVDDAGCAEGFVCETGGIIPECAGPSCCTALCDMTDPVCPSPTVCGPLELDPQPGLENVGACYVPQ